MTMITSFTSALSTIVIGANTTITPIFTGGTGVILSGPEGGNNAQQATPVASGVAITISPITDFTYTLFVTSTDGNSTESSSIDIEVTIPTARRLATISGATGVVHSGTNDYYCNGAVYFIRVMVDPNSMDNHIAQTNEDTIQYQLIINNTGIDPLPIVGLTNLNLILAIFKLTWA